MSDTEPTIQELFAMLRDMFPPNVEQSDYATLMLAITEIKTLREVVEQTRWRRVDTESPPVETPVLFMSEGNDSDAVGVGFTLKTTDPDGEDQGVDFYRDGYYWRGPPIVWWCYIPYLDENDGEEDGDIQDITTSQP